MLWRLAFIFASLTILVIAILVLSFPGVAQTTQELMGGLAVPEFFATAEESQNWERDVARGYGEGVYTAVSVLYTLLGTMLPGILFMVFIFPWQRNPQLDPWELSIPLAFRMGVILFTTKILIFLAAALAPPTWRISGLFDPGIIFLGAFVLIPWMALSLLALLLGGSLVNWIKTKQP